MSRLTSTQVIDKGDYLNPDFDPTTLTVTQLLGVLGYHNIKYPTPYSKPKLVQLFNDEIKTRASKFKKESLKKANSIASDDGIMDGLTGQPLNGGKGKAPAVRRSSRRLSRPPVQESEEEDPIHDLPEPPKRRRSSAQPAFGGPSRKVVPTADTLVEESEPEEEDMPRRKISRSKKASDTGTETRRISFPAEDSGWEDNNIFQSGAESSSPARPSIKRPKAIKKSTAPRKSRKSTSAPPQMADSSSSPRSPRNVEQIHLLPPRSAFRPVLPSIASNHISLAVPKSTKSLITAKEEASSELIVPKEEVPDDDAISNHDMRQYDSDDAALQELTAIIAEEDDQIATQEIANLEGRPKGLTLIRVLLFVISLASAYGLRTFKSESASIGYCDTGGQTNTALEALRARRLAIEACNRENRTLLYGSSMDISIPEEAEPCPLPLIPYPRPDSCTRCPEHATCSQFSMTCDTGYLLKPNAYFFYLPAPSLPSNVSLSLSLQPGDLIWKVISDLADGLPGFGSVAFPPRCLEDPVRKRHIGKMGKAIEDTLAQERGRRLCVGAVGPSETEYNGGDAKRWGIEIGHLRDHFRKKTPPGRSVNFDENFNEAIQQLIQWGGMLVGEDQEGHRYLAHNTPDLTWVCAITVQTRQVWDRWRTTVMGIIASMVAALIARFRITRERAEFKHVAELVQIALDTLRNQEMAHYTDPVTAPQPYLSSLQLRDLILQDEHSIPTRRRLWDRVERIVEGNANVRANLEEIEGGDETRVWRWVGNAGRVKKQSN